MTDRHEAYIVILDKPIREDDAEEGILNAIRCLKSVIAVKPVVSDATTQIAEVRARRAIREKLLAIVE